MIKNCAICDKPFNARPSRKDIKCCSFVCAGIWRARNILGSRSPLWKGGEVEIDCKHCGKKFVDRPSRVSIRKYCSKECQDNARRTIRSRQCSFCGKEFIPSGRRNSSMYCSRKCYSKGAVGEKAPRWLGGKSFEPYPLTFNKEFKMKIRERDNYTCAVCKGAGKSVHHINYVKMDTFPANCITLCQSCHIRTNSNREYWQEYFSTIINL